MNPSYPTPLAKTALQDKIDAVNTYNNFGEFWVIFRKEHQSAKDSIKEAIEDLLDYVEITEENYSEYLENHTDFWDGKNENGHFFCDLANEWADRLVDIYNFDLRKNAQAFSDFEDEFMDNYGSETTAHLIKLGGIPHLLQHIQYMVYSRFASIVLQSLSCNPEEAE
jgi:hypothetical protein